MTEFCCPVIFFKEYVDLLLIIILQQSWTLAGDTKARMGGSCSFWLRGNLSIYKAYL